MNKNITPKLAIEKGFPLPTGNSGMSKFDSIPANEMMHGDSVFFKTSKPRNDQSSIHRYLVQRAERSGLRLKFIVRQVAGGVRIFAVSKVKSKPAKKAVRKKK